MCKDSSSTAISAAAIFARQSSSSLDKSSILNKLFMNSPRKAFVCAIKLTGKLQAVRRNREENEGKAWMLFCDSTWFFSFRFASFDDYSAIYDCKTDSPSSSLFIISVYPDKSRTTLIPGLSLFIWKNRLIKMKS